MSALKAIVAGCVFIFVTILVLQLMYIFIAVGYNALAQEYAVLNDIVGIFRYLVGIPVFIVVMFVGGVLTAHIAAMESLGSILLLCMIVGLVCAGGMIYPVLEGATLTNTGIVIFILAIVATTTGGLYWKKILTGRNV